MGKIIGNTITTPIPVTIVDDALSNESENPVQNKVVTYHINENTNRINALTEEVYGITGTNSDRIDYCEGKISEFDMEIGNIDSALDELHNYAQSLIGGAE